MFRENTEYTIYNIVGVFLTWLIFTLPDNTKKFFISIFAPNRALSHFNTRKQRIIRKFKAFYRKIKETLLWAILINILSWSTYDNHYILLITVNLDHYTIIKRVCF